MNFTPLNICFTASGFNYFDTPSAVPPGVVEPLSASQLLPFILLSWESKLSLTNRLLIYDIILKPIWTYGATLWGTASQSNIEILQRLQNKILRMATDAPWYIPNHMLHNDLQIPTIREEITWLSTNYKAKIEAHSNKLTTSLLEKQGPDRLRRYSPFDLPHRFIT